MGLPINKMNLLAKFLSFKLICMRLSKRISGECSQTAKKSEAPQLFFSKSLKFMMRTFPSKFSSLSSKSE